MTRPDHVIVQFAPEAEILFDWAPARIFIQERPLENVLPEFTVGPPDPDPKPIPYETINAGEGRKVHHLRMERLKWWLRAPLRWWRRR